MAQSCDQDAAYADPEQRDHSDVYCNNEENQAHAQLRAQGDGVSLPGGDQPGAQHADGDEGHGRRTLRDGSRQRSPAKAVKSVVGQVTGQGAQPGSGQRLEVFGQQPHADEDAAMSASPVLQPATCRAVPEYGAAPGRQSDSGGTRSPERPARHPADGRECSACETSVYFFRCIAQQVTLQEQIDCRQVLCAMVWTVLSRFGASFSGFATHPA